jgi:hypothetical protein
MVRVHQDPPFIRVRFFWVTGIRSGSEVLLALITVKRLSLFFKNLEEVCLRSLMRRDVNMGIDCIFDTSIPAYLSGFRCKFDDAAAGLKVWRIKFSYTPMTRCCCLS